MQQLSIHTSEHGSSDPAQVYAAFNMLNIFAVLAPREKKVLWRLHSSFISLLHSMHQERGENSRLSRRFYQSDDIAPQTIKVGCTVLQLVKKCTVEYPNIFLSFYRKSFKAWSYNPTWGHLTSEVSRAQQCPATECRNKNLFGLWCVWVYTKVTYG